MHKNIDIGYRPDIDGLRAIAVLGVVLFHAFPNTLTGGYVGVDVFFVISGYLITSIIIKNHQHGSFSYADFYLRRFKRLFPALVTVLLTTLIIGWYVMLPVEYEQLGLHSLSGLGFVANIKLYLETGYFEGDA
jgi:peptidoglycan/LPS O-acetylase OafA/YrhL